MHASALPLGLRDIDTHTPREMSHFWSAVQFWDEWQLRILVLGSLGVQWFLLVIGPMRKYIVPHWLRTCIWVAYLASDALAIYALATLFNRHAKGINSCGNGASVLEFLWAPVLLIHLGGQEEMAAYSIEDNELWTRQAVTLVSQVSVSVYAFYKSWPSYGDRRLMASAVVLFIIGVLSFCEKPWALRRACIDRLAAVSLKIEGRREVSRWKWCFTELEDKHKNSLMFWRRQKAQEEENVEGWDITERDKVHLLLSDMSLLAATSDLQKRRRRDALKKRRPGDVQAGSLEEDEDSAGRRPEDARQGPDVEAGSPPFDLRPVSPGTHAFKRWLRRAFTIIYTRANVVYTPAYLSFHLLLVPVLHIAAIMLFTMSHKSQGYNTADVKTTYILLWLTAMLDVLAVFIRQLLYQLLFKLGVPALCETLPQHNLINAVRQRMKWWPGWPLRFADWIGLKEGYFLCCRTEHLYRKVAAYVVIDLAYATKEKGLDVGSYRSFTNRNWALNEDLQMACSRTIRRCLRESFDESVLLWHIATHLYFSKTPPSTPNSTKKLRRDCTQAISDYMAYLLYSWPQMLMPGSRQHLFTEAVRNVKAIIANITAANGGTLDETNMVDAIILEAISPSTAEPVSPVYPLIHDACLLANDLIQMPDEEMSWELMYRVWLGMLSYSASMCKGYLHAKSLGQGGEFLSYVWLILSLKGAKTLADKLQMPEPEQEEAEEGPACRDYVCYRSI